MNTRQMEIFVNIVRYGNFSNAAKKTFLSQPAVSANIDLLEKELGAKLLIRHGRKAELTDKGAIFYDYCIKVMGLTEKTIQVIKEDSKIIGTMNIISSFVPGLYLLPKYMKEFRRKHTAVKFEITIKNSKEAYEGVLTAKHDIGFVGSIIRNEALLQKKVFTDEMVLIAPNESVYKKLPVSLSVDMIKDMPFVMRTWGSSTLSITEKGLKKKGVNVSDLNVVAEFDSGEAVTQAVLSGLGVSIISKVCIKDYANILSFNIEDVNMKRDFYAIMLNTDYILPKVQAFYDYLPNI